MLQNFGWGFKIEVVLIAVIAVVLAGVLFILFLRMRKSPENYLRRAKKHHKLGQHYYLRGDEEEAELHYEIAKKYREEALKIGGNK